MKLKFLIKKNNVVTNEAVFNSMNEGDLWVLQNSESFGRPDLSLREDQLQSYGLYSGEAASVSTDEVTGLPVYHFPKEWSVEVVDITQQIAKQQKIQDRSAIRQKCLAVVDMIAAVNEQASTETMTAIFSNPNMVATAVALLSGAPRTAKASILVVGPSLYSSEQIAEIVSELDAIIASEGE